MASIQPRSFADLLRHHRIAAGLTQEELAEHAGVSARAICALEIGERRAPHKTTIALLAKALGLSAAAEAQLAAAARHRLPAVVTHDGAPSQAPARPLNARHSESPLVGRGQELIALDRHLDDNESPLLLLTGEPGIGKSRLMWECARRAAERGWTVITGGCHRRSGHEPYEPFISALMSFLSTRAPAQQRVDLRGCAWLARLLPELAETVVGPAPSWTLPPTQERRLVFGAVARLLANIAEPVGTLLVLDDLQWAGSDALDLLAFLLRDPTRRPPRIVAALRDTDVGTRDSVSLLLGDLAREGLATRIALPPLDRQAAQDLLSALLFDMPSDPEHEQPRSTAVLDRVGGLPLFLVSYAQELRVGALAEDAAENATQRIPRSVVESIRQRWAVLPVEAQDVLAVAAMAGRQVSRPVLIAAAKASQPDEAVVLAGLDAACHARLLVEAPDGGYLFSHDLIREVVEAMLSGARQAALHRHIALALEESSRAEGHTAALAWHWIAGDEPARALPYALRTGDQAETVHAHSDAERSYAEVIRMARACGDQAFEARGLERRADVRYQLGRFAEAIADLDDALAIYRERGDWEGVVWATTQRVKASDPFGHVAESLAHVEAITTALAALATARAEDQPSMDGQVSLAERMARAATMLTPRTAARLYLCLTSRMVLLGRLNEVAWTSERTEAYAVIAQRAEAREEWRERQRPLGMERPRVMRSLALSFRAAAAQARGNLREAALTLEDAVRLAQECHDVDALGMALSTLADVHERLGELGRAKALLIEMRGVARECEAARYVAEMECRLGSLAFIEGNWAEARRQFNEAVVASGISGPIETEAVTLYAHLAAVSLARLGVLQGQDGTDDAAAITVLTRALEPAVADEPRLLAAKALAERDLVSDNVAAAELSLETILAGPLRHARGAIGLLALGAWAALREGAPQRASALLREAAERTQAGQDSLAHLEVLHVQSLLAMRQGQWEEANGTLELLLKRCRALPFPWMEAKALYVYGQLQVAQGDPLKARQTYERALAICARLGERLYAARIERALAEVVEQI